MWTKNRLERNQEPQGLVAVAIDKDKGSQYALKWTLDHLLQKGQSAILIHVIQKISYGSAPNGNDNAIKDQKDASTKEIFLPFRCFCTRKEIQCIDVVLEDTDIAKAIVDYVSHYSIENLVLGACSKNGLLRFRSSDIPTTVSKGAPDFCTVYVIGKAKVTSVRSASRPAPALSPSRDPIRSQISLRSSTSDTPSGQNSTANSFDNGNSHPHSITSTHSQSSMPEDDIRSPFARSRAPNARPYGEISKPETDISFISSHRPSTDRAMFPSLFDHLESGRNNRPPRLMHMDDDVSSNQSFESPLRTPVFKSLDQNSMEMFSGISQDSGQTSWSSHSMDEVEAEMKRLKLELKQTMEMYSTACKEALTAKQTAKELHLWKLEEEQKLEEAKNAEGAALAIAEKEKMKCRAAMEAAEASQRIAELESQKRMNAEMKAVKEAEEKKKALQALAQTDVRYRKYSIEEIETATEFFHEDRKIGEGGYGPVYKCYLDHTPVAVKVLRPESAAQGRMQFQQEVEVLSCIRHPNMVLLLGACPDYGCLVYEYMANGSLDDRLFCRGNTPPLSWQLRFRIASEIATGLLFLHQTKPEPLVHRDLKPGNILLDRNFVSKISDVGLARLVPPNVANHVTQYRMTSTAGTFCYIDPEYQQTGMLGIKSDVYSLGIMLLQIITAKPPMGLTHHVEKAIEKGTFQNMLDPAVPDWPVEEAMKFAKMALQCAELRRKDRPDLGTVILPELQRLRALADEHTRHYKISSNGSSPNPSFAMMYPDVMSDPQLHSNDSISATSIHGRSSVN